jgi:hypothetical protein
MTEEQEFQRWCLQMWGMLAEGAMWGIPRSGLIFHRREGKLVLTQVIPWQAGMADESGHALTDADDLLLYQRNDYETIKFYFNGAGIEVDTLVDFDA